MTDSAVVPTPPTMRQLRATMLAEIRAMRLGAVDMLAAGVAHEVNNPLAYVSANVNLLGQAVLLFRRVRRDEELSAAELDDLDFLLEEGPQIALETLDGCARIGNVVRRLAAFADPRQERSVDLCSLVTDVVQAARAAAGDRLTFALEAAPTPALRGSPSRIGHVVYTLIENAREAVAPLAPGPAHVRVRVCACGAPGAPGPTVELEVRDEGPPLSASITDALRDPFRTTGRARTGALGLALATEIMVELGGSLTFEAGPAVGNVRRAVFPAPAA